MMARVWRNRLISTAAMYPATAGGYQIGLLLRRSACETFVEVAWLAGLVLLLAGIWRAFSKPQSTWAQIGSVAMVLYVLPLVVIEPFAFIYQPRDLHGALVWLCPLVLGALLFGRHGRWLPAAGCCLVFIAAVACLTFNVHSATTKIGFVVTRWD